MMSVTLVRHPISSSIHCVAGRELGADVDADYASDPAPNNRGPAKPLLAAGRELEDEIIIFIDRRQAGAQRSFLINLPHDQGETFLGLHQYVER